MVSINSTPADFILKDIRVALSGELKKLSPFGIDCAFAAWIYPEGRSLINPNLAIEFAVTNYTHVAQLAYLMEIDYNNFRSYEPQLYDGLMRMSGRSSTIIGVGPAPFCTDALALLGLALGAKRLGGDVLVTVGTWMRAFIDVTSPNIPGWKKLLMHTALYLLNQDHKRPYDNSFLKVDDVKLALQSRGLDFFTETDLENAYHLTCKGSISDELEFPIVAARLQVIEYISKHLPVISVSQPKVDQVVKLLENIPNALRRWVWEDRAKTSTGTPQKWDIQNEYHVQSLLSLVLTPIFPDIETEFYLENAGPVNPRADIGLPSLNLIVEVKFLRHTVSFSKMLEEIAADATLYFKKDGVFKKKYSKLLVFLWDNSNRSHEHGTFKNGVKGFNNVLDVVVISRPSIMETK